ncbi:MAG: glycoside hydrolase family 2 protein, partial [Roseburia sp.]|nr:glycoside hydrolase family 2 protein [Roseburia sp.]
KSLGKQKSEEHFFYFQVPNEGESVLKAVAGDCTDESKIRKVEEPNQDYILKEKGAVLNWFDVTAPEGYFSLNDKMGDILASEEGKALLGGLMKQVMGGASGAAGVQFEMSDGMMQMMGGFTILRMVNMMGMMNDMKNMEKPVITKEMLLGLNAQLNQIKKPE